MTKLKTGDKALAFTLPDQDNKLHKLSEYKNSWILLYFYPKDNTGGCTKQACAIRDDFYNFEKLKIVVLGVSVDSVESHAKFAKKYELPFTLLSDSEKEVVNLYGVWGKKKFMGREYDGTHRMSFLIDPSGKIAKVYEKVTAATHAQQVLEDLKELQS
jgi:thioredoxin-dependent peroxiredoxin